METNIEKDFQFFENSRFFDTKIKNKIKKLSSIESFQQLISWCSEQCYLKPKEVKFIGNKDYVKFFLFSIFRHKEILEIMWINVGDKFDKSFRERLINNKKQFANYLWELFLTYFFVKKSLDVQHDNKNKGPDIRINNKNEITWVECIAPECGNTSKKVPLIQFNGVFNLPLDKIKKRLKNAINNKVKKYKEYIKDSKIVNINDKKYIAVSTCNLSQYGSLMDISEPLLLTICKEMNFFENNPLITGLIYSHTSIFDYSNNVEIVIINSDYTMKEKSIQVL